MQKNLSKSTLGRYLALLCVAALFGAPSAAEAAHRHHLHHATAAAGHKRHHAHSLYVRPQPASFIVDADTGRILEAENADSPRYPASLTKMMTLYLTFDALKKGKLHLDQTLPVSPHAAGMPQTNLALRAGDQIPVRSAILSLVVRSANDAAVVLGEGIGGSESQFAEKMTLTARKLGMTRTVFHNANGLPDPGQHTTARDMVTLGLALRRHFPEYFPFFKTESFSYQGRTYVTHNHVMMRYEGVDGIKTGFIRASGFNLVTSANRGNHHLVACVMGGSTWRSRDDKMIHLLDQTFTQLALLDGNKNVQLASMQPRASVSLPKSDVADDSAEGEGDLAVEDTRQAGAASAQPQPVKTIGATAWGIQVGAFAQASEADDAARRAVKLAPDDLGRSVVATGDADDSGIHRAQLTHLTQAQAESACHKLAEAHGPCFVYKAN
jgi:D-alanyl-D-alanine carboxypeptidase